MGFGPVDVFILKKHAITRKLGHLSGDDTMGYYKAEVVLDQGC